MHLEKSVEKKDFFVEKDDLSNSRWHSKKIDSIDSHQILIKIDSFSFTSNNITYAILGESMKYWQFFPVASQLGQIPVWGIGTVVESHIDDIRVNDQFYGFYPMSNYLILEPGKIKQTGFTDITEHRNRLPVIYNNYTNIRFDQTFDQEYSDIHMLMQPLFATSFLIADMLVSNNFYGSQSVIFSSASSKTAIAAAYLLKEYGVELIGLTSNANAESVKSLNLYSKVVPYSEISDLALDKLNVFIDFAGNIHLNETLAKKEGIQFTKTLLIGNSHGTSMPEINNESLLQKVLKAEYFFAPLQYRRRMKELGAREFAVRFNNDWVNFRVYCRSWMNIKKVKSMSEVEQMYLQTREGKNNPLEGNIVTTSDL